MTNDVTWDPLCLPYLTGDLPGIGGAIKQRNDDFVVDEIPLYEPGGEGTHTYFTIEKQGRTTLDAIQLVARALGRPKHEIGYAGLKDAHGVTRQTFSIEHVEPGRIEALNISGLKILRVAKHVNKLKLGHLAGNRFSIKVRDVDFSALELAKIVLERLVRVGLPNYFGPQRFGARGDNAAVGRAMLMEDADEAVALVLGRPGPFDHGPVRKARELFDAGDVRAAALTWPPKFRQQIKLCLALQRAGGDAMRAWHAVDHTLRNLYVSAFQSHIFNRVLADRIGGIHRLETGDIAWKHVNGACFLVQDAAVEQARCDAFEISPTGPLFGPRMTDAAGAPGIRERQALADTGVPRDRLRAQYLAKLVGGRRPLRVKLREESAEFGSDEHGPFLLLAFTLPPGAYATGVLREICKSETAAAD